MTNVQADIEDAIIAVAKAIAAEPGKTSGGRAQNAHSLEQLAEASAWLRSPGNAHGGTSEAPSS